MGSCVDPVGVHAVRAVRDLAVPVEGWFVDKYGPRVVVLLSGILCAIGWVINAEATTLNGYYLA